MDLILYFLRGSKAYFLAGAVCACFVTLFDLVIPRLIQYTVDAVIGGDQSAMPAWAAGLLDRLGGAAWLRGHLWAAALGVAAAAALGAVCRYAFRACNAKGAETLVQRMRDRLFRQLLSLPQAWQNENSAGDILQRCTSDVETIKIFVSEQLTSLLRVFILVFLSLYFMASIQPRLTLAAAFFIPVMIISSLVFYGLIGDEFETVDSEESRLSAITQENLTGVRVVRTFGREKFERERFEAQNEFYTNHWIRLMKVLAAFWVSGNVIATVRNMTVAVYGAVLCVGGQLTAGGLIAFLSYNALMSLPVRSIGRVIAEMSKAGVSIDRLRYIMNAVPEDEAGAPEIKKQAGKEADRRPEQYLQTGSGRRDADGGSEMEEQAGGSTRLSGAEDPGDPKGSAFPPLDRDIVFENVRFRYREDAPEILRGVSMTIRAGTTVGILGATGAGKSTLVQLLVRLWELPPEQGRITIGGIDIRNIDRGWLRQNIGMVLQEPYLFSRTLAENIAIAMPQGESEFSREDEGNIVLELLEGRTTETIGKPAPESTVEEIQAHRMQEIRRAAQTACLEEDIERFSDGYGTFVGERGVTLSGGQKQRTAIAQMLVRHTPVMVFDDALSAVDAQTDARIRRNLQEYMKGATVILIAHRITTLRQADEIFVLDGGRIAEHGTHDELLAQGGIYSRVHALQRCLAP